MITRMILMILALGAVFGGIFGFQVFKSYETKQYLASYQPPPVAVAAAPASAQTWTPYLSAVGTLAAVNGVDISTEVPGIVEKIYFQSGQEVKQGTLLVQLDDDMDQADLQNYQTQLKLAQVNFQKDQELISKNFIARVELDKTLAALEEARAQMAKALALIDEKKILAPFSGKLGISQIGIGQYLAPGTAIVTLQSLTPLYVNFTLPEQALSRLRAGQPVTVTVDAYPGETFSGQITALDARVNEKTHTIQVQATLPNEDRRLYPGLFANVQVLLPQSQPVVTVPQTAVAYTLYGDSVFVVEPGPPAGPNPGAAQERVFKVAQRYVTLGEQRGSEVAVVKGLKAGEQVVTAGQLKLKDGARVTLNNSVTLKDNPRPAGN